jgi:hypothetical protein
MTTSTAVATLRNEREFVKQNNVILTIIEWIVVIVVYTVRTGTLTKTGMNISDVQVII